MSLIRTFKARILHPRVRHGFLLSLPFWVASVVAGVLAVLYAQLFAWAEGLFHHLLTGRYAYSLLLLSPAVFLCAVALVRRFAPNARGSGIPQVMAAIELAHQHNPGPISQLLSLRVLVIKIISSTLMVLGGGVVGREGPTIQISASVFQQINAWLPARWPKVSRRNMLVAAAASGLAAAFNTPLGGMVFAVEELARNHVSYFRTALLTAVVIAGLTAQTLSGPYLYLGYPRLAALSTHAYIVAIAVALLGGLAGAALGHWALRLAKYTQKFNARFHWCWPVIVVGLLMAGTTLLLGEHATGSGKGLINQLLFSEDKSLGVSLALARTLGLLVTFAIGAAGGVFAPSLSAGAALGAVVGSLSGFTGTDQNALVLVSMVAFLTGVTRSPFTAAILVIEMTDRHSMVFLLLLSALLAQGAAHLVDARSLYEQLKMQFLAQVRRGDAPPKTQPVHQDPT